MFLSESKVREIVGEMLTTQREEMVATVLESVNEAVPQINQEALTTLETTLNGRFDELEERVSTFAAAPGATIPTPIPAVDPQKGDALSALEELNQFCETHKSDHSACMNAIAKFNQQS